MQNLFLIPQFFILLISPALFLILGLSTLATISEKLNYGFGTREQWLNQYPLQIMLFGLLWYLTLAFAFKYLGLPWVLTTLLPFAAAILDRKSLQVIRNSFRPKITLSFVVWFLAVLALGISLFEFTQGIRTPWVANYGDVAFHIGMITSMVLGDNFFPEYHIFAGVDLSYPLYINFWSALFWWIKPGFYSLGVIFVFQWTFLWSLIFFFLKGRKYPVLPWVLLFGGGSLLALGNNSGALIGQGVPWTLFLTSIWITQRSAMFGICVLLAAVTLAHQLVEKSDTTDTTPHRQSAVLLCGLLIGLSPLVHTHLFVVCSLYCGLLLLFRIIRNYILENGFSYFPQIRREQGWKELFVLVGISLLSLVFLPFLLGKQSAISFMTGWTTASNEPLSLLNFKNSIQMWLTHATLWVGFVVLLWLASRKQLHLLAVFVLFLLFNVVKIAYWDFDQIKLFIGLYAITLAIWSLHSEGYMRRIHYLAIVLIIPTSFELIKIFKEGPSFEVYSDKGVRHAQKIVEMTGADAIFAAAPTHNNPVTLTGRRLFRGYPGTLWSHGIDEKERVARRTVMEAMTTLATCRKIYVRPELCPDFLYWDIQEQQHWKEQNPADSGGKQITDYLYKLQ